MENTYLTAYHGMEGIFDQIERYIRLFHRNSYKEAFEEFFNSNQTVFAALEEGYGSAIEKEVYLSNMADAVTAAAAKYLSGFQKKHVRNNEKINLNLMMVSYIIPGILKMNGSSAGVFVDILLDKWKEQFPESNISSVTFEEIEAGFHRKWCYITTAVCQNSGKPDDCYELTILRDYRDHYLKDLEQGDEMIREYYDVAPTIVKHIDESPDRNAIYAGIYRDYIQPCISMIEEQRLAECKDRYRQMVRDLQETYFFNN